MAKATEDSTNASPSPQLTVDEINALAGRLTQHAEKIESIIARPLVQDLLLASRAIEQLTKPVEITIDLRGGAIGDVKGIRPGTTVVFRDYDIEDAPETDRDDKGRRCFILRWEHDTAAGSADLFVNVYENVDGEPVRSNVPLSEAIGDDTEEYEDCRRTILSDGKCTTGGGASPLYHLVLVGRGEGR